MRRERMLGNFELVYEQDMNMYRIMNRKTERFSAWFNSEKAEELKEMEENDFFKAAEKALKNTAPPEEKE